MARYAQGSLERVKEAVDMVELVGTRTELRRVGGRFTGRCPFHDERTPSFSVSAEHGLYHCFGCGESGDAITFVEKTEALGFVEAIEFLAERAGIELERESEDPREEERRRRVDRLRRLVERAADYYARVLWDSPDAQGAREHLRERGLGEEVLREFRVGYAPAVLDRVVSAARRDGFADAELLAAGLAQPGRNGGAIDRFRGRIMFPLADGRGRVLGFGARAVREDQVPKYLNTSENELYHKGRQLFGLDRARAPAAKAGRIVVVEGYTDVLALHQAGVREAVASMGTALTPDQLRELSRAAPSILLAFDADGAGQEAMLKAARAAAEREVELRVVTLPEGDDPAELVAGEGAEAFAARLEAAISVPEFAVARVLARADLSSARGRDRALAEVRPLVAETPEKSATRDALARRVADRLDVPERYVLEPPVAARARAGEGARRAAPGADRPEVAAAGTSGWGPASPPPGGEAAGTATAEPRRRAAPGERADRAFLALCVAQPVLGRDLLARVGDDHLSSAELRAVRDHLLHRLEDPLGELPAEPVVAALVTEVAMLADRQPSSPASLRISFLQLELRRIDRALRRARESADDAGQGELFAARERVRREVGNLMGETA